MSIENSNSLDDYSVTDRLRNGSSVLIRLIHTSDEPVLVDVMRNLTPTSRYFRYLTMKRDLSPLDLRNFTVTDTSRHIALLAYTLEQGQEVPMGLGEYFRDESQVKCATAELALTVKDQYQGIGVGSCLLKHVARLAGKVGIKKLMAIVHSQNSKMLEVLMHSDLRVSLRPGGPMVEVNIEL